ncbi:MAG TPA: bifunctional phosphoglucose/phosphomannose isomerase [Anaerolineales bacterium]|nr:bifunctional phosphoglucose/phosphomannose isomerase [Anaerolineales bacterium]
MNLDDLSMRAALDPQDMYQQISSLPDQLNAAWQLGKSQPLPAMNHIRQIVLSGMGGSAIGADLLAAYSAHTCPFPVMIHRDYDLPAFANGPDTLVVASSHSGNTEETLSGYELALQRGCRTLAITTGGKLAQLANASDQPVWRFSHDGQPRAAVGFSFALLLALLTKLNLIPDPSQELHGAIETMRQQQENLHIEIPTARNPAKRLAGQLVGRWVSVFGSGLLAPVARRWKGQISELAKAWAQFEFLPEANHNTLAGILNPEALFNHSIALFLQSSCDHPRNQLRSTLTRQAFLMEGLNTDVFHAQGDTALSQLWSTLHFGDYMAYYLAMAYAVDPTPVAAIEQFKLEMAKAE